MNNKQTQTQNRQASAFPVMKFDYNFNVIYSNEQANDILSHWKTGMQQPVPSTVLKLHPELYTSLTNQPVNDINLCIDNTVIRCSVVAFPEAGYIGLYGYMVEYSDKIAERATVARMN